ncbi:MAG TPA: SMP-30/gluconolactonase/LRE family protein [Methylomirabilota bacterium]|nr:SMP-30/gluconolactonase/LRE family protein [Methylomirabilota bacterium]
MGESQHEVVDARFREFLLGNCRVERLYQGTLWAEGPVYFADGDFLVWSDIPRDRMLRWTPEAGVSVFRQPSSYANGNTRDRQGRLVTCEHGARRVTRTEWDGTVTVLAEHYQGKRFNSPNDVVVKSDGSVWFTDPPYGILSDYEGHRAESELGACYVFRLDPISGSLEVVADDLQRPNGLAFSPDEAVLYVSDTARTDHADGPPHIRVYDVVGGRRLVRGRRFARVSPGAADGLRPDTEGNVWTSAGDGVHCYSPDGELLGKVRIPEKVSNCTFGGPKKNRLFVTATTSLYAVFLNRRGAQWP